MYDSFSQIEAVIFDMDGVLFLSSDCHERAFREVFAKIGIMDFSYAAVAGMRTEEAIEKILRENGKSISQGIIHELSNEKRKRVLTLLGEEGDIAPESKGLIDILRKKYRLVLASSASPQTVEFFLRKSGYADAFEVCLNGSSVSKAKPDPEIYLLAAKRLDIAPKWCIVIEDALSGVEAAKRAGMQVIAILGTEEAEKLTQAGAIKVVSSLKELSVLLIG